MRWITKSGRFGDKEIEEIEKYVREKRINKYKLLRLSVLDVVTNNRDVNTYLQKGEGFKKVFATRFTEEEIEKIQQYLQKHGLGMNDLIRASVFYYLKNVDTGPQSYIPEPDEVIETLRKIVNRYSDMNDFSTMRLCDWYELFAEPENIRLLGSIFTKNFVSARAAGADRETEGEEKTDRGRQTIW